MYILLLESLKMFKMLTMFLFSKDGLAMFLKCGKGSTCLTRVFGKNELVFKASQQLFIDVPKYKEFFSSSNVLISNNIKGSFDHWIKKISGFKFFLTGALAGWF